MTNNHDIRHFYWKYLPCRPVQYRWNRAMEIVDLGERMSRRFDEPETIQAVEFLRSLRRCSTEQQRAALAQKWPEIHAAYQIHETGGELSLELQARILARHGVEELAGMFGMEKAVIDCYERLFFSIRDRMDAHDYILIAAIGGINEKSHESLLKYLGYSGGPVVLDAVLPYLLENPRSVRGSVFEGEEADRFAQRVQLFEKTWKMPDLDLKTALELLLLLPEIEKLQKESKFVEIEGLLARLCPEIPENLPQPAVKLHPESKSTNIPARSEAEILAAKSHSKTKSTSKPKRTEVETGHVA